MIYLFPIPYTYSKVLNRDYSEIAIECSTREKIREWVRDRLTNTDINIDDKQKAIAALVVTTVTCTAITCFSKFITLGCVVISAIAYIELAKMVETKSGTLKNTLIAKKVIKHLIDPNQQGQKFTQDLEKIERELKSLKKVLWNLKKYLDKICVLFKLKN